MIQQIDIAALPFLSRLRIFWGFLWRNLVITIASFACASLVLALARFFLTAPAMIWGISPKTFQVISGAIGMVVGICFFYLYVSWLFQARLGRFKIVLMTVESEQSVPAKAEAGSAV